MIGIGLDFGTSNSAAAIFDGKVVRMVHLEDDADIMPTATHLSRELNTLVGAAAVLQYIDENRDRMVELTPEVIAKTQILIGERDQNDPGSDNEVATSNTYGKAVVDRGMQGRLFRGVKRLLGNPSIKRLMVFDHPFRLVALITPVLVHIRSRLQGEVAGEDDHLHFGHPVLFEGQDQFRNDLAFSRLTEACQYAGFNEISFYPEPVAATVSWLQENPSAGKGTVLTVDFGGGTLDLSVLAFEGTSFKVLSTAGQGLGGDHIDQLIFRKLLFPLLGKGEIWRRVKDGVLIENQFPFEEFEDKLLNWAVTYTLNQNHYRAKIADCIRQGGPAAEKFSRLDDLITHNQSYLVFQAIRDAKARLSEVQETTIDIPELDIAIPFSRQQFEAMMQPMLGSIEQIISRVMELGGVCDDDIDVVIRTGGSSQIVAVREQLEARFRRRVTEHDPFSSVAAGLAIANYHGYRFQPV